MTLYTTKKSDSYISARDVLTRDFVLNNISSLPYESLYEPYVLDAIANIDDAARRKKILKTYLTDTHDPSNNMIEIQDYVRVANKLTHLAFNVENPQNILELNLDDSQIPIPNTVRTMLAIINACRNNYFEPSVSWPFMLSSIELDHIPNIINLLDESIPGSAAFIQQYLSDKFLYDVFVSVREQTIKSFIKHIDVSSLNLDELTNLTTNLYFSLDMDDVSEEGIDDHYILGHLEPHLETHPYWSKFKDHILKLESIKQMSWDCPDIIHDTYQISNASPDIAQSITFEL